MFRVQSALKRSSTAVHGAGILAAGLLVVSQPADAQIEVLLRRCDPVFTIPIERHEDGLPLGNGDVGTMLWTPTDEGGLVFQLNKVDAFAADNIPGVSPYYWNTLPSLARLVVRPSAPLHKDVGHFRAALSMEDGVATLGVDYPKGRLSVRSFVAATRPVLVVELHDTRPGAGEVTAALGLWRIAPDESVNAEWAMANYGNQRHPGRQPIIIPTNGEVVVTQTYRTATHYRQYAVAVGGMGGKVRVQQVDSGSAFLSMSPGRAGKVVVLAAVAVSDTQTVDAVAMALGHLVSARQAGMKKLVREHTDWWTGFWKSTGTYVSLHSADGLADYLEAVWYACLYQTASTSRGVCPPKFNGSIFLGDRDNRQWGGQYWLWNTESMYFPLFAQNAMGLTTPFYDMYWAHLPAARQDARDLWASEGALYSEGCMYDQKVVQRSPGQITQEQKTRLVEPQFNYTSHLLSGTAEVAWMFYKRFDYTRDVQWLRDRAYPLMKECAAFYMSYFKKGADGRYHIYPTNGHEAWWGVRDGMFDLAAVRWLMPRLIQASQLLNADADLRPKWQEFLDNQPPYPTAETPGAQGLYPFPAGTYAAGLLGAVPGRQNGEAVRCTPVWPFENIGIGISENDVLERMRNTLPSELFGNPDVWAGYPGWSRVPIMAARLGMKDHLARLLVRSAVTARSPLNRIELDHEVGLVRGEVSQLASTAVNEALLQSHNGLLQLFAGWPDGWDGRFRLLAEGMIFVEAEKTNGVCRFVALDPRQDIKVSLVNPWPGSPVTMHGGKGKAVTLLGGRLELSLIGGRHYVLSPAQAVVRVVPELAVTNKSMTFRWQRIPGQTLERHLGLLEKPGSAPSSPADFGPFSPTSQEEVDARFLPNGGCGSYGENHVLPGKALFSSRYEGSLLLTSPSGRLEKINCAYVAEKGRDESALWGDLVMEADFISERGGLFGFFFRQRVDRSSGVYHACLEQGKNGYAGIRFGLDQPDVNLVGSLRQMVPTDLAIENGVPYRLRLTVKNVSGLPMRFADAKLEVFKAGQPGQALASGSVRLNLSNDNMPDAGQAGIYVFNGWPIDPSGKPSSMYVRNLLITK